MTHIFNVAIDVDDTHIKEAIEKRAYDDAVNQIKSEIKERFRERYDQDPLGKMAQEEVKMYFEQHRDGLMDMTAKYLADKLARTKQAKAVLGDALDKI